MKCPLRQDKIVMQIQIHVYMFKYTYKVLEDVKVNIEYHSIETEWAVVAFKL